MIEIQKETLDYLVEISKELNRQTTELNSSFLTIEKKLADMKLGVSGWSNKIIGVKEELNTGYKFGFCRVGKDGWKLVCRKIQLDSNKDASSDNDSNYGFLEHIITMPRSIRLEASTLIEEVIQDLIHRANLFSKDVNEALENLNTTDASLHSRGEKNNG